jgi:four helix bundle protein
VVPVRVAIADCHFQRLVPADPLDSRKDLVVWQKSMNLVERMYSSTRCFPKEEMYGITSQMRRAGISVAANIAEGQARNSIGEFRNFLGIAKGSLAELETLLMISERLEYLPKLNAESLLNDCEEIGRLLGGLMKSLNN